METGYILPPSLRNKIVTAELVASDNSKGMPTSGSENHVSVAQSNSNESPMDIDELQSQARKHTGDFGRKFQSKRVNNSRQEVRKRAFA